MVAWFCWLRFSPSWDGLSQRRSLRGSKLQLLCWCWELWLWPSLSKFAKTEAKKKKHFWNDRLRDSGNDVSYPAVELGNAGTSIVFRGEPGRSLFPPNILDVPFVLKLKKGRVLLSTCIRDAQGNIVAELSENEWGINEHDYYAPNYSRTHLINREGVRWSLLGGWRGATREHSRALCDRGATLPAAQQAPARRVADL
jgi:hypothetical protein